MQCQAGNAMETFVNGGYVLLMGDSTSSFDGFYVGGSNFGRNPYGGWTNVVAWPSYGTPDVSGSPSAYQYFGVGFNLVSAISKGRPNNMDAIRYGRGDLYVELGDTGAGTFSGMATANDGSSAKWGLFQDQGGSYLWKGLMSLGTSSNAVTFTDSGVGIAIDACPRTYADFNKIEINHVDSVVSLTRISMNAIITSESGSTTLGVFEVIDNADVTIESSSFSNMSTFTFLSNTSCLNTSFVNCGIITTGGADISGCSVSGFEGTADDGNIIWNLTSDPSGNLDTLSIIKGTTATHAIEFSTLDTSGKTYTISNCDFSGYNVSNQENDSTFNFLQTSGAIIINANNCTGNLSYKTTGSTTVTIASSVSLSVSGVTEGSSVVILANETVGSLTKGDVILEGFADDTGELSTPSFTYEGAFGSGVDVIVRSRNQGIAIAAIAEEDGVGFTDETTEASSNATDDMTLLPVTPSTNDAYYFGHNEQFSKIKLAMTDVLTWSSQPTIVWEYYNGSWVSLSGVSDATNGFESAGEGLITYTDPAGWTTTTVNTQGPFYYIRARLSVPGTITQVPTGAKVTLDTTKYLPYDANREIVSGTGLADIATWSEDTISQLT